MVCADGSQSVNNGEKQKTLLPLNFVQNLGQPVPLFLTVNDTQMCTNLHSFPLCLSFILWMTCTHTLFSSVSVFYSVDDLSFILWMICTQCGIKIFAVCGGWKFIQKFVTIFQLWKGNFVTSSTTFPPLCLQKIMYLCEKKDVNNEACT